MKTNKIILASASPRRKELFEKYHLDFIVDYIETEEVLDEHLTLSQRLENIALQKALPLKKKYPNQLIVSADTMVTLDQKMLGKPKDRQEAKEMLMLLSNKKQIVITAVCMTQGDWTITFHDQTDVIFKKLSDEDVENYLDQNEWRGKAGAYAIQGLGAKFVESIHGDIETVIGMPMKMIIENLKNNKKV